MKTRFLWASDYSKYFKQNVSTAVLSALVADSNSVCHVYVFGATAQERAALGPKWTRLLQEFPDSIHLEFRSHKPPHPHFIRAEAIVDMLAENPEPFWVMDGDIVVRGKIPAKIQAQLAMRVRPFTEAFGPYGTNLAGWLNAGVIYVSPTPDVKGFWTKVRRMDSQLVENAPEDASFDFVDQETYALVALRDTRVPIRPLDDSLNDSYFRRRSLTWHFKGKARRKFRYSLITGAASPSSYRFRKKVVDLVSVPFWVRDYLARTIYTVVLNFRLERAIIHSEAENAQGNAALDAGCLWNARARAGAHARSKPVGAVEINPERHAHSGWPDGIIAGCSECILDARSVHDRRLKRIPDGRFNQVEEVASYLQTLDVSWRDIRLLRFFR